MIKTGDEKKKVLQALVKMQIVFALAAASNNEESLETIKIYAPIVGALMYCASMDLPFTEYDERCYKSILKCIEMVKGFGADLDVPFDELTKQQEQIVVVN